MTQLLHEIRQALAELLQSGLATAGPALLPQLHKLSVRCEEVGLHTGSALLSEVEKGLSARTHTITKDDIPLSATIFRLVYYLELCEEKLQQQSILQRWHTFETDIKGGSL